MILAFGSGSWLRFQCNLCGRWSSRAARDFGRELPSCRSCRSTVRLRALAYAITSELLGAPALLSAVRRPDLRGLGTSDAPALARALAGAFDYRNTFFDRAPRLDITTPPDGEDGRYDFVVSSDVFEHVAPPPLRAFEGACRLLRPGGRLFLTVPYRLEGPTVEHYPELHAFRVEGEGERRVLVNVTRDGREQRFPQPVFHGGEGQTLELRVFSLEDVHDLARQAGFASLRVVSQSHLEHGVVQTEGWSLPLVLEKPRQP